MSRESLIRRIHDSGKQLVIATTGGGATAIGELLAVPGGSQSVLECVVAYSAAALSDWIGGTPDQSCSEATARAMAMAAFERARQLAARGKDNDPGSLVGVGATASLVSDRPKRGPHRIHVAWQSATQTSAYTLELHKGKRGRREEEEVCATLILTAIADAADLRSE